MNLILNTKNNLNDEEKNEAKSISNSQTSSTNNLTSNETKRARISILAGSINDTTSEAEVVNKPRDMQVNIVKPSQNADIQKRAKVSQSVDIQNRAKVSENADIQIKAKASKKPDIKKRVKTSQNTNIQNRNKSNQNADTQNRIKSSQNTNIQKRRESNLSDYRFRGNTYSKKADINKVTKFFAISCIIIGSLIAGKSVYALTFGRTKPQDTPQVSTDKMGKEVTISISTQYPIKQFSYRWNDGEETEVKGNDTVDISKIIEIPNGNNILNITVIDYYGNKTQYQKTYLYESSDIIKPTIRFEKVRTKLRIIANDETALLYMTYQWNDEEPIRIDATESQTELSEEIEVEKGRGKLTIVAVDKEENKETITRTIVGANKPTFTIDTEQNNLVVKAKDDDGLKNISIFIDEEEKKFEQNNDKEATVKVEIQQGTHLVKIVVTNINDQEATRELRATI